VAAEKCRATADFFNHAESCPHSAGCGVAPAAPIHQKEQAMKSVSRVLDLTRNAGLVLLLAGGPLAGCAGSTSDSDLLDQTTGDLKGGIPANGKGKGKDKGEAGAGGAIASADDDAGVDEGPGNGKDKTKKPKKDKTHGANAGASGGDTDEAADESADEDVDESGDESADQDRTADESADSSEDAAESV